MPPGSTQCQSLVISRSHVPLLSWDAPVRSSYFPPWEYSVILSSGSADNSNKKLNSHFSESQCDCPRPQLPHRCPDGGSAPADVAVTFDICSSCLARSVGVYTQHRRANSDHLSRWSDCCVHRGPFHIMHSWTLGSEEVYHDFFIQLLFCLPKCKCFEAKKL